MPTAVTQRQVAANRGVNDSRLTRADDGGGVEHPTYKVQGIVPTTVDAQH